MRPLSIFLKGGHLIRVEMYTEIPFLLYRLLCMQIDLHLHCDEWNQLFSSGQWEPEVIVRKLPAFLQFVKEVQGFVVRELQGDGQPKGKI